MFCGWLQLQEIPGLVQRMAALMCVDVEDDGGSEQAAESGGKMTAEEVLGSEIRNAKETGDGFVRWLELEELGLDDAALLSLNLSTKFPVSQPSFYHTLPYSRFYLKSL